MILIPLDIEFDSAFVGEDGFVKEGFFGFGLARPKTLVGMPIGGGEVILGLPQGDSEHTDDDLDSSRQRGVKKPAPPCLGVLGLGGFVTK